MQQNNGLITLPSQNATKNRKPITIKIKIKQRSYPLPRTIKFKKN